MDPARSGGRLPIPPSSTATTLPSMHANLLGRPSSAQDILHGPPASSSWHSNTRDNAPAPSGGNNSNSSSDAPSQSYGGPYSTAGPFDNYIQHMSSSSDLLSGSSNPSADLNRGQKKRQRDDGDEPDPATDVKYGPSPDRLAQLTAGFPTPPNNNGPPQLITTGRMTKTHADPLIAQLINPDGTPKRPMNAFMIFARKRRPEVAADNPNLRTGEISKLLSAEWKSIDTESKQFYLTKAKELKENFTSIFPTYVYKRRPNNSRKRRKTEDNGYGGPGAMNAIDRGEGGLSEDEGDGSPPGSMSPSIAHPGHPMGGLPGMSMSGHSVPRRPGDPSSMHLPHPHHGIGPPPAHDLPGPYSLHGPPYPPHRPPSSNAQVYYEPGPGGQSSGSRSSGGGTGGSSGGGSNMWPSLDSKRGNTGPPGQNGSSSLRNGTSSSGYNFSIPSPNFGPGPGLPPLGRGGPGGQGGSSATSANQPPLLGPMNTGSGTMLPPPTTSSIYSNHGHGGSSHSLNSAHGGGHGHAHSGSSFYDNSWPRSNQSPSSSALNLNGPTSSSSTNVGSGGQSNTDRQSSSRSRADSLGGSSAPNTSSSSWNM